MFEDEHLYWIFAFKEYTDFSLGNKESLFGRLRKNGKWYIGNRTQNRKRIKKGDRVIFYQTGEEGLRFVGNAVIESSLQQPEKCDLFSFVIMSEIKLWEKEIDVREVETRLSFQKSETPLQYYFQMAIRRITEQDYYSMMRESKQISQKRKI